MNLYHYTCSHGHDCIGDQGHLHPVRSLVDESKFAGWPAWKLQLVKMVWLTDLDAPMREALGLTSKVSPCDRTQHRYRMVGYSPIRYTAARRDLPKRLRDELESAPGAMPMHWWFAYTPVPVVYDPIEVAA